eukprot:1560106-Pyramimonas_sp.AAC.1
MTETRTLWGPRGFLGLALEHAGGARQGGGSSADRSMCRSPSFSHQKGSVLERRSRPTRGHTAPL